MAKTFKVNSDEITKLTDKWISLYGINNVSRAMTGAYRRAIRVAINKVARKLAKDSDNKGKDVARRFLLSINPKEMSASIRVRGDPSGRHPEKGSGIVYDRILLWNKKKTAVEIPGGVKIGRKRRMGAFFAPQWGQYYEKINPLDPDSRLKPLTGDKGTKVSESEFFTNRMIIKDTMDEVLKLTLKNLEFYIDKELGIL